MRKPENKGSQLSFRQRMARCASIWNADSSIAILAPNVIELKRIPDSRGNLTVIEQLHDIPFEIKRLFFLYDVPTGESRGAHAHIALHQFLVCLSGSFDLVWDDGASSGTIHLNRPWQGVHVPPMVWASEQSFDPGSVCLVVTSDYFCEDDYIRNKEDFYKIRSFFEQQMTNEGRT